MIPKLLTSLSGEPITNSELWENFRREECFHLLEHYVYGERPAEKPDNITFNVKTVNEDLCGMLLRHVNICCDGFTFKAHAFSPKDKTNVPVFVYCMHEAQQLKTDIDNEPNNLFVPIADIAKRGYGVIVYYANEIYPEHHYYPNHEKGIIKHYSPNREKRRDSHWSTISAWAFAASRVADFIETDEMFDINKMAVCGHSRGGKTALWAGATDKRFSYVISNSSGCTGAAILRGKEGEHIDFIQQTNWMCENYHKYADYEEMLPIDQHFLLAMIAPRLLYVQSSAEDSWSDPAAERRACRLASEVYELYGKKGVVLPDDKDIETDKAYHDGYIGYHQRTGEHAIRAFDWEKFIDFWEKKGE